MASCPENETIMGDCWRYGRRDEFITPTPTAPHVAIAAFRRRDVLFFRDDDHCVLMKRVNRGYLLCEIA
jgi:hypothetical protein